MSFSRFRSLFAALAISIVAVVSSVVPVHAADMGTTWNNATLPSATAGLDSIAFGNGVFVGVNTQGDILRSTDGKTWTSIQQTSVVWSSAAFGGGVFVILGDDGSGPIFKRSSDNGVTFSNANSSALNSGGYTGLSYGQSKFIALDTQGNCDVAVSSDAGQTWVDGASSDSCDSYISSAFGNNTFVSISSAPSIEFTTNPNSVNWNPVNFGSNVYPLSGDTPSQIAFNGSVFMFLLFDTNGDVYVYTSSDGENWADGVATSGLPSSEYSGLAWDGAAWLAGANGNGEGIYRSVDGVSWTQVDSNNTQWYSFATGSGIVVAGGQPQPSTGAQGLNSTIAVGWSTATTPPSPVNPSTLPNTGMNAVSMTISAIAALGLIGFGMIVLRRSRKNK